MVEGGTWCGMNYGSKYRNRWHLEKNLYKGKAVAWSLAALLLVKLCDFEKVIELGSFAVFICKIWVELDL